MASPAPKSPFDKWKETIDQSLKDSKWNAYDEVIFKIVTQYNDHLNSTPGYRKLDWKWIKAMVWTETGPYSDAWSKRPMQIGNAGDPGLSVIINGQNGSDLVVPSAIRLSLSFQKARTDPATNIQAGVGYLLTRCAEFGTALVYAQDSTVYTHIIKAGDSLDKIARENGTTIQVLREMNPTSGSVLSIGKTLQYKKAANEKCITGWRQITTAMIAAKYNVGDPKYQEKLDYCLRVMK